MWPVSMTDEAWRFQLQAAQCLETPDCGINPMRNRMCVEWLLGKQCAALKIWFWQVQQRRSLRRNGISMMSMWTTRMWRHITSICSHSWKSTVLTRRSTDGSMTRGNNRQLGGAGPERRAVPCGRKRTLLLCMFLLVLNFQSFPLLQLISLGFWFCCSWLVGEPLGSPHTCGYSAGELMEQTEGTKRSRGRDSPLVHHWSVAGLKTWPDFWPSVLRRLRCCLRCRGDSGSLTDVQEMDVKFWAVTLVFS